MATFDLADSGLSQKQQLGVNALIASGGKVLEASRASGIGRRTLCRYRTQSAFLAAYEKTKENLFADSMEKLSRTIPTALDTLENLMREGTQKDSTRLGAATRLLDIFVRTQSVASIEKRIAGLEGVMQQMNQGRTN